MNRFVKSVVILATLLHATLGCHAHHAHAGAACCISESKTNHDADGHDAHHGNHGHTECGHTETQPSKAPCDHSHFPTQPCSEDCDGACCSWWVGPNGPEVSEMVVDLFSLAPNSSLDFSSAIPMESPRENPVSCLYDDHLRRHLSIQILLI